MSTAASYPVYAGEHVFDFRRPDLTDLSVQEVATSLSRLFRWRGSIPVSVAQHSVVLARYVKNDDDLARWCLLHDATEVLIGDLPSPLKALPSMQPIRNAERRMLEAVAHRFNLPLPEPPELRVLDVRIRRNECLEFLPSALPTTQGIRPLRVDLAPPWSSAKARREFLAEARRLEIA